MKEICETFHNVLPEKGRKKRMGGIFIDSIREGYEGSLGSGFTKRKDL